MVKISRIELGLRKVGLDDNALSQLWPGVSATLYSGDGGPGSFVKILGHRSLKGNKITFLAGHTD